MEVIITNGIDNFNIIERDLFGYYKENNPLTKSVIWCEEQKALDGSNDYLIQLDVRVLDYALSKYDVVEVDTTDTKWFNQNPIL